MEVEAWLAFAAASFAVLMIPGPTILLVVGFALSSGRRAALGAVVGVLAGDALAVSVSAFGLGALLATSAAVFTVLKWVGAAYLIYLGITMWRAPVADSRVDVSSADRNGADKRRALQAFIVTALKPKTLAFFVAFLPQFMDPSKEISVQVAILTVTFVALAAIANVSYALAAGYFRDKLERPQFKRILNRLGVGFLIGAGILTVAMRRG